MLVLLLEAPVRTCVRIFQPGGGVQKKLSVFNAFRLQCKNEIQIYTRLSRKKSSFENVGKRWRRCKTLEENVAQCGTGAGVKYRFVPVTLR